MNDETDPTQPLPAAPEAGASPPSDAPVSERTPAATGTPFVHRHSAGIAIAAGALAVVLLAGGTAWAVSAAVASSQTAQPMSSTSMDHASGSKAAAKKGSAHSRAAHAVRGTLAAIDGSTWTVHTASGATVTVTITSSTTYGTTAKPADRSSFAVGELVGVIGKRSGDTITATRVLMASTTHATTSPTAAPTT